MNQSIPELPEAGQRPVVHAPDIGAAVQTAARLHGTATLAESKGRTPE